MTAEFTIPSLLATGAMEASPQQSQPPDVIGRMVLQGLADQAPEHSDVLQALGSEYVVNKHTSGEGVGGPQFMTIAEAIGACPHFAELARDLVADQGPAQGVQSFMASMRGQVRRSEEAVEAAKAAGFLGQ